MSKVTAKVEQGTFTREKWAEIKQVVQKYEGKTVTISFSDESGTDPQNRYWWSTVIPHMAEAMGEIDKEYVHSVVVNEVMPELRERRRNPITHIEEIKRPSWAKMDKAQRSECIKRTVIFAATFYGYAIPEAQ